MKKADIKTGVVYAYQRNRSYDSPTPVVFLAAPSEGKLYNRPRRFGTSTGPVYRLAAGYDKPKRATGYADATTGYPVAKLSAAAGRSDLSPLIAVTLADFEAATSSYSGEGGVEFDLITTLTQITGPYGEAVAAYDAHRRATQEHQERVRADKDEKLERAKSLVAAFGRAGVRAQHGDIFGSRKILLSLDEAAKLAEMLEAGR